MANQSISPWLGARDHGCWGRNHGCWDRYLSRNHGCWGQNWGRNHGCWVARFKAGVQFIGKIHKVP
ncbi:hypothetical protein F7725_005296 [Dissostichus mawsoni]|uniref:Uncharacterized protein n=1 Tax=Dissostichus mawsoni TaxID=36200 RepID=A0A7J5YSN7_DISMA|nr:hypothetical protein F7725_005296 [Dissostichus mawsoni]